jgi:hypothetical protein
LEELVPSLPFYGQKIFHPFFILEKDKDTPQIALVFMEI